MCYYKTTKLSNKVNKMVKSLNETAESYRAMASFSTLTASKWLPMDVVWIDCVIASLPGNKVKNCFPCPPFEIFELPCDNFQCTFWFTLNNYQRIWANSRSFCVSCTLGFRRRLFSYLIGTKKRKSVRMLRVFETCSTTERGKVFAWVERCLRIRRGEGKACEAWAFFLR